MPTLEERIVERTVALRDAFWNYDGQQSRHLRLRMEANECVLAASLIETLLVVQAPEASKGTAKKKVDIAVEKPSIQQAIDSDIKATP